MKTVGIITFHSAHNYGAALQAYALQSVLKERYKVFIINFRNEYIDKNFSPFYLRKGGIKVKIRSILINIVFAKMNIKRYNVFEQFFEKYYVLTSVVCLNELREKCKLNFDVYITGSDQVWNPNLAGGLLDEYTLNWGESSAKRISYAASVGDITVVDHHKEEYITKLKNIDAISVREHNLQEKLHQILNRPVDIVLDPTLLLGKERWDEIAVAGPEQKYIFAYAIGNHDNHRIIVNEIAQKLGLPVLQVERKRKYDKILINRYDSGPCEFLGFIRDSEMVITTSFHATVFALIYHKNFIAVPPIESGERIMDLLRILGIERRCITSKQECGTINLLEDIDYESVDKILDKERVRSLEWLFSNI